MNWNTSSDFFHMGGYGLYVWGSYGMVLAGMLLEPLLAHRRHRQAWCDTQAFAESET